MTQLTLLPYELLQLIAENLLPRYQCRLAMASSLCYQLLYNDLLKWHAQKDIISVPKHDVVDAYGAYTILFTGKNIIIYDGIRGIGRQQYSSVCVSNLSTRGHIYLRHKYSGTKYRSSTICIVTLYIITTCLPKQYLNMYRKYLHKDILLLLVNMRTLPYLYQIDSFTREHILNLLSPSDIDNINSCDYLSIMLS